MRCVPQGNNCSFSIRIILKQAKIGGWLADSLVTISHLHRPQFSVENSFVYSMTKSECHQVQCFLSFQDLVR